jgi:hypothetical protein
VREYGIRELKDKMSRDILTAFSEAGLQVASTTVSIVNVPELQVRTEAPPR